MTMRKALVVVVVLAVAGLFAWRTAEALRARSIQGTPTGPAGAAGLRGPRAVPVQVVRVQRATLEVRRTFVGEVVAEARVDVLPRIGGVVEAVLVAEGERVAPGQPLVRLDPKELRFQVEQARAAANTQRVLVEQARGAMRTQALAVEQARAALATQQARLAQVLAGTPPEQVRQAEEQVRQARAGLEFARAQLRRMEDLYAQGFVSGQAVESARLEVTVQETRLRTAEEQLALLRRGPRPEEVAVARGQVRQAEVALQQAEQQAVQAAVAYRQAQSQLAQSQVALHQAENLLRESVVRAPAGGIVGRRLVDPGTTVTPATPLLQIVDVDPVFLVVPVAEQDLAAVRPGTPAAVRPDALPSRRFAGEVSSVSPVLATTTRTAETRIRVPNPEALLRPGMTARVELLLARRTGVLAVPAEAVLEQDGVRSVFVVEDGLARARPVALGVSDGTRVEVVRGLQPGEMVVVAGQHNLRDGSRVILPGQRGPGTRSGPPGGPQPGRTP